MGGPVTPTSWTSNGQADTAFNLPASLGGWRPPTDGPGGSRVCAPDAPQMRRSRPHGGGTGPGSAPKARATSERGSRRIKTRKRAEGPGYGRGRLRIPDRQRQEDRGRVTQPVTVQGRQVAA